MMDKQIAAVEKHRKLIFDALDHQYFHSGSALLDLFDEPLYVLIKNSPTTEHIKQLTGTAKTAVPVNCFMSSATGRLWDQNI